MQITCWNDNIFDTLGRLNGKHSCITGLRIFWSPHFLTPGPIGIQCSKSECFWKNYHPDFSLTLNPISIYTFYFLFVSCESFWGWTQGNKTPSSFMTSAVDTRQKSGRTRGTSACDWSPISCPSLTLAALVPTIQLEIPSISQDLASGVCSAAMAPALPRWDNTGKQIDFLLKVRVWHVISALL